MTVAGMVFLQMKRQRYVYKEEYIQMKTKSLLLEEFKMSEPYTDFRIQFSKLRTPNPTGLKNQ